MSIPTDSFSGLLVSCMAGVTRGVIVKTAINPLEVVKVRLQASYVDETSCTCFKVIKDLYSQDGSKAFFRGLKPQVKRTCIKQAWGWPLLMYTSKFLDDYSLSSPVKQGVLGLSIATVDAGLGTPFERLRMAETEKTSLKLNLKNAWKGMGVQWCKLAIQWPGFLVTQDFLKKRRKETLQINNLAFTDLTFIGIQTAFIVGAISAPADFANTAKQVKDKGGQSLLTRNAFQGMLRSLPVALLSLTINNVASVVLLDMLKI